MPVGLHLIVITLFDLLWDGKANYGLSLRNIPGHGGRIRPQVSNRDIDRSSRAVCKNTNHQHESFLSTTLCCTQTYTTEIKTEIFNKRFRLHECHIQKEYVKHVTVVCKRMMFARSCEMLVFIDPFGLRFPKTSKDQFDSDSMKNYNNAVHKYATLLYSADSLCWDIMQMNSNFKSSF